MSRWFIPALFGVLFIIGAVIYSPSLSGPWQYDDHAQILDQKVLTGRSIPKLLGSIFRFTAWPDGWTGTRDLVRATFRLNWDWWGNEPAGYRWINLLIHVVNATLVAALVRILLTGYQVKRLTAEQVKRLKVKGYANLPASTRVERGEPTFQPANLSASANLPGSTFAIALFAGLLFLLHPLQSQAVAYVAQRFTSLATTFYLSAALTFSLYNRYKNYKNYKGLFLYAASLFSALLAFNSKEITITLPVALLLIAFALRPKAEGQRPKADRKFLALTFVPRLPAIVLASAGPSSFVLLIPFFLLALKIPLQTVSSSLTGVSDASIVPTIVAESAALKQKSELTRQEYFLTQINVVRTYLRLVVLPVGQTLDYDYPITRGWDGKTAATAALHLGLIGIGAWLLQKKAKRLTAEQDNRLTGYQDNRQTEEQVKRLTGYKVKGSANLPASTRVERGEPTFQPSNLSASLSANLIGLGILWFYLALLVESSFIPIADVIYEHRVYLPFVGVAIAAAGAAHLGLYSNYKSYKNYKGLFFGAAAVWLLLLSAATVRRAWIWGNEVRLWADVWAKAPEKPRANKNYGVVLAASGQYEKGIERLARAVELEPDNADYWGNFGTAYLRSGQYEAASGKFLKAYDLYRQEYNLPAFSSDPPNLPDLPGLTSAASSLPPEKRKQAAQYLNDYGVTQVQLQRGQEALEAFQTALAIDPSLYAAKLGLGAAKNLLGDLDGAVEVFWQLTQESPDQTDAWNNLAIVLTKAKRYEEALAVLAKLKKLNPSYPNLEQRIKATAAQLTLSLSR